MRLWSGAQTLPTVSLRSYSSVCVSVWNYYKQSQFRSLTLQQAEMAQQFVKAQIKGDKVVVFMKPTCSFCIMAKDVLSNYKFKPGHIQYIDINSRSDMDSIQDYLLELTGQRTVNQECA